MTLNAPGPKANGHDEAIPEPEAENVNLANAVDLSASSSEEELEDLIDDFALSLDDNEMDLDVRQERLYFFQFPAPFPTFAMPPKSKVEGSINLQQPKFTD